MMSQQKRKSDGVHSNSKKVTSNESPTRNELEVESMDPNVALAKIQAALNDLQVEYSALQAINDAAHLREHQMLLRPVIKREIESWVREHAFIEATEISVDVTKVETPAIGRERFEAPSDDHRRIWSRHAFTCEFSLHIELRTQRFLQHAVEGFVQKGDIMGRFILNAGPAPNAGEEDKSSLTVEFFPCNGDDSDNGVLCINASHPFNNIAHEAFPTTAAPASHLLQVLFFSHRARYDLLERVWALASFVVPGSTLLQRAGAVSLRKLFFARDERIPSAHVHVFGYRHNAYARVRDIANALDCEE